MDMHMQLMETLGIEIVTMEKDNIVLTMPVDERTHQPAGFLHGGASVLLAETAASMGGYLNINPEEEIVFGIDINANHLRSKKSGTVTAVASPFHIGKTTMVWEIKIDRKSTRLNSSHVSISYAVFCLKKKKRAK